MLIGHGVRPHRPQFAAASGARSLLYIPGQRRGRGRPRTSEFDAGRAALRAGTRSADLSNDRSAPAIRLTRQLLTAGVCVEPRTAGRRRRRVFDQDSDLPRADFASGNARRGAAILVSTAPTISGLDPALLCDQLAELSPRRYQALKTATANPGISSKRAALVRRVAAAIADHGDDCRQSRYDDLAHSQPRVLSWREARRDAERLAPTARGSSHPHAGILVGDQPGGTVIRILLQVARQRRLAEQLLHPLPARPGLAPAASTSARTMSRPRP